MLPMRHCEASTVEFVWQTTDRLKPLDFDGSDASSTEESVCCSRSGEVSLGEDLKELYSAETNEKNSPIPGTRDNCRRG